MDFRCFWCVLVLIFDIEIGLYSHSIGFPRFRMLLQKVLLLLPTSRFIEKKCRCRHQACQGDKKNIIALSSDATHGFSFSQRKGVSAVGLWESECIWMYPAFKDGIKEKCSRIRQILGVIALVYDQRSSSWLHPIGFGCLTMCQPHPNGVDLRNFKLKKRCPNHNYKRWKIVTQCSKYRTTAEPMWILYNSSKTKPTPPCFPQPWKVTHFPNRK